MKLKLENEAEIESLQDELKQLREQGAPTGRGTYYDQQRRSLRYFQRNDSLKINSELKKVNQLLEIEKMIYRELEVCRRSSASYCNRAKNRIESILEQINIPDIEKTIRLEQQDKKKIKKKVKQTPLGLLDVNEITLSSHDGENNYNMVLDIYGDGLVDGVFSGQIHVSRNPSETIFLNEIDVSRVEDGVLIYFEEQGLLFDGFFNVNDETAFYLERFTGSNISPDNMFDGLHQDDLVDISESGSTTDDSPQDAPIESGIPGLLLGLLGAFVLRRKNS